MIKIPVNDYGDFDLFNNVTAGGCFRLHLF